MFSGGNHDLQTLARDERYFRGIKSAIKHERYRNTTMNYDIGVIEVDKDFNFAQTNTKPTCLFRPIVNDQVFRDKIVYGALNALRFESKLLAPLKRLPKRIHSYFFYLFFFWT